MAHTSGIHVHTIPSISLPDIGASVDIDHYATWVQNRAQAVYNVSGEKRRFAYVSWPWHCSELGMSW